MTKPVDVPALFKRVPALCHFGGEEPSEIVLRVGGVEITADQRDELLGKIARGEYVEVEVEFTAYEQKTGERNRKHIRIQDGKPIQDAGRTGRGRPFLKDHEWENLLSRGGTLTGSKTERVDEGHYKIRQTARLTSPWAVDAYLRGNLDRVSIGALPTGPVLCSLCNSPIFSACYHLPGQRFSEREDSSGKKYLVRASDGDQVVEWIYTAAELVETSAVSVPAVASAVMDGIRAALSAHGHEFDIDIEEEIDDMKTLPVLATKLGLAATAGEDEVLAAVETAIKERDTNAARLAIAEGERVKLAAIVEEHRKVELKTAQDTFIRDAVASRRITLADESAWRRLHSLDPKGAEEEMAKRPQTASPVNAPLQSAQPAPAGAAPGSIKAAFAANGVDADAVFAAAKAMGATNPEETAARLLNIKTGG